MRLSRMLISVPLLLGLTIACSPDTPSVQEVTRSVASPTPLPTTVEEAMPTATAEPEKTIPATEEPSTPTPTALPTTAPTSTPTEVAEAAEEGCLSCHADQERLIETAAPEEEKPPSESSGVG